MSFRQRVLLRSFFTFVFCFTIMVGCQTGAQEPPEEGTAAAEAEPGTKAELETKAEPDTKAEADTKAEPDTKAEADAGEKSSIMRLDKKSKVWADLKRNLVIVDGQVVLREGQLEMFACPRSTKEHESVVAIESKAFIVHAALLAVGAKTGSPVQFAPEYVPASGTEIDIYLLWVDAKGKRHKSRAQDWIRQVSTGKPMPYKWVFAGSGFWVDEETREKYYQAEDGDMICVSNFSTAMLDLPVESSQSNEGLMFDAFTENIPPIGTKVRMILVPKLNEVAEEEPASEAEEETESREKEAADSASSGSTE